MTKHKNQTFCFSDLALSRRLEKAEALSNVDFVETRARRFPQSGASWLHAGGAYAMFDGVKSPLTQSFCLGIFQTVTKHDLVRIEQFFQDLGAEVLHEISPIADLSLLSLLQEKKYHPVELTSVMYRPINSNIILEGAGNKKIQVHLIRPGEEETWAQTSVTGWSEFPENAGLMQELAIISANRPGAQSFLVELEGVPIAAGAMSMCDGVALLAGASTIPSARKQGAQRALLECRLRYAARRGCDLAMMCALPGSSSQRNAERQGFRIAYTRIKWKLQI
jgi:GNAT superfamily N-acetyltransferase